MEVDCLTTFRKLKQMLENEPDGDSNGDDHTTTTKEISIPADTVVPVQIHMEPHKYQAE